MNDLILITASCNTKNKEGILRNLVNQIDKVRSTFDLMIISHNPIPSDISIKCDFVIYDKKDELLFDWDLRKKPNFTPDGINYITSIFSEPYNNYLAILRQNILANSFAKSLGYNKTHRIKYDSYISDFSELGLNSRLLENHNCITYDGVNGDTQRVDWVDDVDDNSFDSYQAYRLDNLHPDLLLLNEENIKNNIRNTVQISSKKITHSLLHHDYLKGVVKQRKTLDRRNGNRFEISEEEEIKWCLPYFDNLDGKLKFIIWNPEEREGNVNVKIYYNNSHFENFEEVTPNNWSIIEIGEYDEIDNLTVILNGKIKDKYDFTQYREEFKKVSYNQINDKSYDLAFYTCFYGSNDNEAFTIPDIPSLKYNCYYYTNNKDMIKKLENTKWIAVYDNKPLNNNIIESCMNGKHVKTMPHLYKELKDYSYTCFLDSKLDKVNDIFVEEFIEKYFKEENYAILLRKHWFVNDLWEEFEESMLQPRYIDQKEQYIKYIHKQIENGLDAGIKQHCACGFLIRNMKHKKIKQLNETWYKHIQECGIQDQISFNFVKQLFEGYWYSFTEIPFSSL